MAFVDRCERLSRKIDQLDLSDPAFANKAAFVLDACKDILSGSDKPIPFTFASSIDELLQQVQIASARSRLSRPEMMYGHSKSHKWSEDKPRYYGWGRQPSGIKQFK